MGAQRRWGGAPPPPPPAPPPPPPPPPPTGQGWQLISVSNLGLDSLEPEASWAS